MAVPKNDCLSPNQVVHEDVTSKAFVGIAPFGDVYLSIGPIALLHLQHTLLVKLNLPPAGELVGEENYKVESLVA